MWINDDYYDELVRVLGGFAEDRVNFDEQRFEPFKSKKYCRLTNLLKDIKGNTKANITNNINIMASLENGRYVKVDELSIQDNDFKVFYEKYNSLVNHHEKMSRRLLKAQETITEKGKIDARVDTDEVSGKWFDDVNNINLILESLSTPIEEVASVINNVAIGKLNTKMRLKVDGFEVRGGFLNLATTINTMVDQVATFSSEVTRVAKEVGTEGVLGGQARVEGVSGTWLELTNNVNGMADNLTAQVRNISEVTTAVAKGDLTKKITVDAKGEVLTLKGTINVMVDEIVLANEEKDKKADELKLANEEKAKRADELIIANEELAFQNEQNINQNWIKDGVYLLNERVRNKETLAEQIETSINELSRYVSAGVGAIYIYDSENDLLKLEGSYAYTKREHVSNVFKLGEGIVGQVASEKKPILLTNVPDQFTIHSGTTKAKALNIYTYPLIFKEELIAVAEVASYEIFSATILEYLDSAFAALAGSLYTSIQATSTSNLLVQSQNQSQELVEQSQQLTSKNKELQEQRESMDIQRQELQMKNSDLELAQVEANTRSQDLEDANRYKSEFLANMSHELRTPLNSMLLLSSSLSKVQDIEPEKLNKQADTIYDAGSSLLNLINDILDLSKIEAKLMTISLEKIDISSLLHELKELFIPQAEEKNIQLESIIDANALIAFSSDKSKLTQILRNFISNAIKFTDNDGSISIELTLNTEEDKKLRPIVISIIDNGIGIEEGNIYLIFEAFKQADGGTSRQHGGTGLGLSISKELTELLGGRISVKSLIGHGSSFSIYIPLNIDTDLIDESLIEHIQYENIPSSVQRIDNQVLVIDDREKLNKQDIVILVVEDNAVFANIVLEEAHKLGHKAIVAGDGNTAISMAREYMPTAIILDVLLPVINGMEVLRILKSDINTRHIPINILSCTESQNIAKKLGAFDYITKPIQESELANLIKSLVDFVKDKQKHILIIEDEKVQAKGLVALLTDKNISVKSVGTAKQGLKEVKSHKYDCAIVDLGLPDMSGFKLLALIEKESIELPIIIYTAKDLTNNEWVEIRKYSDSVVLKTATSDVKLIEEVSLFLHSERISLNAEKQQLLAKAMDTDLLLEGKKLLIVDDDMRNIYALSSVLEDKGLDITSAQNGKEALELLQNTENKFDIVLMDIMMPVMDGYEAMREIKKNNRINSIPIIALTAKAQAEDKQLCIDSGADDYMAKPIDNEQLLSLLKVWLVRNNSAEI